MGLIAVHDAPLPADDGHFKAAEPQQGAIFLRRLCALKYADLDAHARTPEVAARRADVEAFEHRMDELAKTGCYTMRQLTVNGADLMDAGIPRRAGRRRDPANAADCRHGRKTAQRAGSTAGGSGKSEGYPPPFPPLSGRGLPSSAGAYRMRPTDFVRPNGSLVDTVHRGGFHIRAGFPPPRPRRPHTAL